jgi:hypothetical protein
MRRVIDLINSFVGEVRYIDPIGAFLYSDRYLLSYEGWSEPFLDHSPYIGWFSGNFNSGEK